MTLQPSALEQQIALCDTQRQRTWLSHFDSRDAWALGNSLYQAALQAGYPMAIDITVNRSCLFSALLPGASGENIDWVRRKRNLVDLLGISSWEAGLMLEQRQTTLEARYGVSPRDYAPFGGSYPLQLTGCGMIGTVTVSGAPQRDDHNLVVRTLWAAAGQPLAEWQPVAPR
ncbi:heme-degrading domain-containing protein [Shimwellia pseudoproteus]|uniref:heme-degrading domain-containing protein n=1 Tax=Shimwellia pseudoproteus TaxID=570012 RepID=UPI0018EC68CE|nr:heme-degrading domain-containing protein [Shimwellia pseudoproteus]MBJ3813881.1 heme-degrading domain-containing protein [Shimwellia pseudoproteus]